MDSKDDIIVAETPAAAAGTGPPLGQAAFTGERGPLFRLVLVNTLLILVTLGIYRFWAKTRLRRYFWSHTRILGGHLEYTGTPGELFVGFLIALAVLFPLGAVYGGVAYAAQSASTAVQVTVELVYYVVILALIYFAFYRMWRYRLSRTTWRGIRFGLDGTARRYMASAMGWTLASLATLGVAVPWARMALARYRINNMRFGSTRFAFDGTGRDMLWPWMAVNLLMVPLLAILIGFAVLGQYVIATGGNAQVDKTVFEGLGLAMLLAYPMGLALPFVWLWYRVREFRYVMENMRLGSASMVSGVTVAAVVLIVVITYVIMGIPLGLLVAGLVAAGETGHLITSAVAVTVAGVVLFLLVAPIVTEVVFRYELVGHVCRTLLVVDPDGLEEVVRSTDEGPQYGEGLGDAFDVGAI